MCSVHTEFDMVLAEMDEETDAQLQDLCDLGQTYINQAVEMCSSSMFDCIWTGQESSYDSGRPSHTVELWVAPTEDVGSEVVQNGSSYSSVPSHQMPAFVAAVQEAADACCAPGITAQVGSHPLLPSS